jgi:hypothetical protein
VEEVGVEAVLQSEQHLGRLAALAAAGDVAEVVESFDAGSGDDPQFGRIVAPTPPRPSAPASRPSPIA